MKIGIICASDNELAPFIPIIKERTVHKKAMLEFYEGKISDVDIVALYSGVCKVNAAVAAQILIDTFRVDAVINSGVAGGMDPRLAIFDAAISTEVAYHDVASGILTDFHPWMNSVYFHADDGLLESAKAAAKKVNLFGSVYFGRMVTGESFISDDGRQAINDAFTPLTVDMETAAIAHVCYVNKVPFISIRCVTDNAAHSGEEYFEKNCKIASDIAKDMTVALLNEL